MSCLPAKSSQIRRNIDSRKIAVANAPRNTVGITGYTDNALRGTLIQSVNRETGGAAHSGTYYVRMRITCE